MFTVHPRLAMVLTTAFLCGSGCQILSATAGKASLFLPPDGWTLTGVEINPSRDNISINLFSRFVGRDVDEVSRPAFRGVWTPDMIKGRELAIPAGYKVEMTCQADGGEKSTATFTLTRKGGAVSGQVVMTLDSKTESPGSDPTPTCSLTLVSGAGNLADTYKLHLMETKEQKSKYELIRLEALLNPSDQHGNSEKKGD